VGKGKGTGEFETPPPPLPRLGYSFSVELGWEKSMNTL
jgi:hypothetical protein